MTALPAFYALALLMTAASLFALLRPVAAHPSSDRRITRWMLVVAVPVLTVALYAATGRPDALSPAQADPNRALAEDRTDRLAARLGPRSDDEAGLLLLARSYAELRRFVDAAAVHERLVALRPDDADALIDYAEALSLTQGGRYVGRPGELVARALQRDANHPKALAIAANAAAERDDLSAAVDYWERLARLVPEDSDLGRSIRRNIVDAQKEIAARRPVTPS